MVARFCAARGIAHQVLRWQGWDGQGNLLAAARAARFRLIGEWARGAGVGGVMLGHTADDVAETFVMRLGRAAGVDGLAAMKFRFEREGVTCARPLLGQSRAGLRAYLAAHDVPYVDDPTNEDESYQRVRIRKALSVLGELGIETGALVQVAQSMQMARAALVHYTAQEAARVVVQDGGDLLIVTDPQPPVPDEIKRRLLARAISWVGQLDYPPRATALAGLDAALATTAQHTIGGCLVSRADGGLRVAREWNAVRDMRVPTTGIWDGRWRLEGPHDPALCVAALGEGIRECADWRDTGQPRASLMASPAVWRGESLIAAPLAGLNNGWRARIVADFPSFLLTH